MTAAVVRIGAVYTTRVSGKLTTVRIERTSSLGGWIALNLHTERYIYIATGRRLRPIKPPWNTGRNLGGSLHVQTDGGN